MKINKNELYTCRVRYREFYTTKKGKRAIKESSIFCALIAADFASAEQKAINGTIKKVTAEKITVEPDVMVNKEIENVFCSSIIRKKYLEELDAKIETSDVLFDSETAMLYRITANASETNSKYPRYTNFVVIADSKEKAEQAAKTKLGTYYPGSNYTCLAKRELEKGKKEEVVVKTATI